MTKGIDTKVFVIESNEETWKLLVCIGSTIINVVLLILKGDIKMNKKKRNVLIAVILSVAILTISGVRIIQIERNYQANKPILKACIDNGGSLVIGQKHLWSLTSATCEDN